MIMRARHSGFIVRLMTAYTKWNLMRHFRGIEIEGDFIDSGRGILLLSNHISWWDGFWAWHLNREVFGRKFYYMMLEEQLMRNRILNLTGGFSVSKGMRSIIETLDYTSELLGVSENLVLMYPQGRFQSIYSREFRFEKGLEYITRKHEKRIQIFFMAGMIDYFSRSKPIVKIYFKEYSEALSRREEIEASYNHFYEDCLQKKIKDIQE